MLARQALISDDFSVSDGYLHGARSSLTREGSSPTVNCTTENVDAHLVAHYFTSNPARSRPIYEGFVLIRF